MAIKERKAKIDKKTGQISTVKIPLLPITWYLQFLKLLVDLEQAKIKLRVNKKIGKGAKLITSTYTNKFTGVSTTDRGLSGTRKKLKN